MPFKNTYTTFDDVECGLVSVHDGFVLPLYLEKCEVTVEVVNHLGHYIVKQEYVNLTDETIDALYIFPVSEGGTVHHFVAKSNEKVVESIVKEKTEESGTATYDEDEVARADTRTNFLLSEYKPDLYQLKLGELEPNSVTSIELRYVCELPMEDNDVVLTLPTTIAPQYTKPTGEGEEKSAAEQLVDTDKELAITVNLKVRQTCAFKTVCSPAEMAWSDGDGIDGEGFYHSTSTLVLNRTQFEEEQQILIGTVSGNPFGARILIEKSSGGEVAAMVTLVPDFPSVDFQAEMIFLVDRSGSMMGRSIEKAKEALHVFLASLPSDCLFNICSFNASFDFLFEQSVAYNNENLQRARQYVDNMVAGGGTRVYEPLETIFKQNMAQDCQKQIFVLTDGHVSRPGESVAMVARHATQGRVFSLGIGEGASRELVNGLARSGNGSALFVTLAEDLKDKVMELLQCSILSVLSGIEFSWLSDMKPQKRLFSFMRPGSDDIGTPLAVKETSAPHPIPHVFSTRLSIVYQSLDPKQLPVGLKISGKGPDGDVMMLVTVDTTKIMESDLLHKLMARRFVKLVEEDEVMAQDLNVKQRMINLGTAYNVSNMYCAQTTSGMMGRKNSAGSRSSASPPASPVQAKKKFSFGGNKAKTQSPAPPPMKAMKKKGGGGGGYGGPSLYKSANIESASVYQVANTRQVKGKSMGGIRSGRMASQQAPRSASRNMMAPMPIACSAPPPQMQGGFSVSSGDESGGSSPPRTVSKAVMRDEALMAFTRLQQSDGSFVYGDAFERELKISRSDLEKAASDNGVTVELFATLIVLCYLRSLVSNRKSSWRGMGGKADCFVAANLGDKDLSALDMACETFLNSYVNTWRSKDLFQGWRKK